MIRIYTDGACSGNPGPGGWACILMDATHSKKLSGGSNRTTNNQMELTAVIQALKALKRPKEPVVVYTDSKYVCDAFNLRWIDGWISNGFVSSSGKPVKNRNLWMELIPLAYKYQVEFRWVKGHDGNTFNEEVDRLAVAESRRFLGAQ